MASSSSPHWYDKHRQCQDNSKHEGRLELITWSVRASDRGPAAADRFSFIEDMGWGNCLVSESEDLRRQFETEFAGCEEKFYEYWPQGFRWTCCGNSGSGEDQDLGCNHHGTGSAPCSCDFCQMGKAIPNRIYNELISSPEGKGLKLSRGPDPRSSSRGSAETKTTEMMRAFLGLPDSDPAA